MTQTWQNVETARLVPAHTQSTVARYLASVPVAARISTTLAGTLHEMRDCMNGQPKAMNTEPNDTTPSAWCWAHENDYHHCQADDLAGCDIDQIQRSTDPTGEAAIRKDSASAAYFELMRILDRTARDTARAAEIVALYPAQATEPVKPDGPGADWCTSCWRNNRTMEPVALRPGTTIARRAGLCRWCGEFLATEKFLPPLNLLDLHHRGVRITSGMVDEARKNHRTTSPTRTKNRKAKKVKLANVGDVSLDKARRSGRAGG